MAAFLTHLVVGERVWIALDGRQPGGGDYGTFLFGCLAPDMDKFCDGLEQGTTHFVAKDKDYSHVWRRSQHFLDHRAEFLRAPFHTLEAGEQAFVLGYLCHVATDEITGRLALALKGQLAAAGTPMPHANAILTAMDPRIWAMAVAPGEMVAALAVAAIPNGTLIFTPLDCLSAMRQIILPQVREGGGLIPYLNMVRRQWHWQRCGWVSNATDDLDLEAELATYRRYIEVDLPASERLVNRMPLGPFVEEAVSHSSQRIHALLDGEGLR